jgi:hypothetical protein
MALVLITFSTCSCSRYYYVPNIQNVPLFREKNESRISGAIGEGDESKSFEIQAAYSITGHLGFTASFMSAKGGDISTDGNWAKGHYIEGAIGYFVPVSKAGVFEIYGGYAGSGQNHHYINDHYSSSTGIITQTDGGTADVSFSKFFVQPSFGLTFRAFDIALSSRISALNFTINSNNITGNENLYTRLNSLSGKGHLVLEPAITIRGGWKNVKVQVQGSLATYSDGDDTSYGEEYHVSVGLFVSFSQRYIDKARKEK